MLPVLVFPAIDPVIIEIGPFALRWYALAYIAGLLAGWRYVLRLADRGIGGMTRKDVDDFLVWATVGIIIGGRLGYALFYNPAYFAAHPQEILAIWRGGMSFHGGLAGVIVAVILFSYRRGLGLMAVGDAIACAGPIGLFFGRLANFVNGELYGRPSDLPWAMAFPAGGPLPRHPSQIYEALLEGLLLFVLLWALSRTSLARRPGFLTGVFLTGYAGARAFAELFRQPDAHIGFLVSGATMGQLLSLPVLLLGLFALWWSLGRA